MKEIDFERAAMLLDVIQKVANVDPMMMSISGEAGEELKAINEDCKENARERADEIRANEQVAGAQRLEAVRAHNEANAKPRGPTQPPDTQVYVPGQPVPAPVGEPAPTDLNRDAQEPLEPHAPEPIGRRLP